MSQAPFMAEFRIGEGTAFIGPQSVALVAARDLELLRDLWSLVRGGAGIADLLDELTSAGLASLGSFAVVQREDARFRFVVRGDGAITVHSGDGDVSHSGRGVKTWVEQVVEGGAGFTLAIGDCEMAASPYRARQGVVPADVVRWPTSSELPEEFDERPMDRVVVERDDADEPESTEDVLQAGDEAEPESDVGTDDDSNDDDRRYDELWGRTVHGSVQDAAVARQPVTGSTDSTPRTTSESLISDVPLARPGAETLGYVPSDEGDHDGMTINVQHLPAPSGTGFGTPASKIAPTGGPMVQAILCEASHPNPPNLATCRLCGWALSGPPVAIPRPTMGTLTLSTGVVITLSRPAILGRNPKVEGELGELPQTLRIDAGQALSRSHLMVRIEGWQVLVEDLRSANGTIVTLPGRPPRRLHPREPFLIEHGARIDLGGEVSADYDARS